MKHRIVLTIREAAQARGITTAYGLQKKLGLYPNTARQAWNSSGQRMVKFDFLEKLMDGLECTLDELIQVEELKPSRTKRQTDS